MREKTGAQLAVVTLASLDGGQIDDFANKLFKQWGIGQQGKDNGLLLIVAMKERRSRIEVGYGLEGIIPDALAGRILDHKLRPRFRRQQYAAGLIDAVDALCELVERGEPANQEPVANEHKGGGFGTTALLYLLAAGVGSGGIALGVGLATRATSSIVFGSSLVAVPMAIGMLVAWPRGPQLHLFVAVLTTAFGWYSARHGTPPGGGRRRRATRGMPSWNWTWGGLPRSGGSSEFWRQLEFWRRILVRLGRFRRRLFRRWRRQRQLVNSKDHRKLMSTLTPEQLAGQLAAALGQRLKCVALYGSAAAGDFMPGASNYNVLVLVDPLGVAELDALAAPIRAWRQAGHPAPMLFTPAQLRASTDAFAIEILDIRQSRRILQGEDLLADLQVHPEHLRLQVERELTGKLLALRGAYLAADGRQEHVARLMLDSLSTFLVLFRATLRLYDDTVPARKIDALHALAGHVTFDARPFERLHELKKHPQAAREVARIVPFADYLAAIETVAAAVNQLTSPKE